MKFMNVLHSCLSTGPELCPYLSSLSQSVFHHLDMVLDWDNNGVDKDLIEIANHIPDWEVKLPAFLHLNQTNINDIKAKYVNKPELQR